MYKIKVFNKISEDGINRLDQNQFSFTDNDDGHGILCRSQNLHDYPLSDNLLTIGRAGAGTNNIPVEKCTQSSCVVFNAPGANANAVKELVLAAMLMGARNLPRGLAFSTSLKGQGDQIHSVVESEKSSFKGFEIRGKRLGVVGLGAIGLMVANDAVKLGMKVMGHDPYISVERAWELSSLVRHAPKLSSLLSESDFVTLHMPLTKETKGLLNSEVLSNMKKGAVLLNFSREEVVDDAAVLSALDSGHLSLYINDFPSDRLLNHSNVISIPHLGASTKEAEINCAKMVVDQVQDYLLNGNIRNSVNFPTCQLERTTPYRLCVIHKNVPKIISKITSGLADAGHNISEMMNKSRGDVAYTMVDISKKIPETTLNSLNEIEEISRIRLI